MAAERGQVFAFLAEPASMRGSAELGGTTAEVRWTLVPLDGPTEVRLGAIVVRDRPLDRVLLALGGRWWLRRRFRATLDRLVELSDFPEIGKTSAPAEANPVTTEQGGLR